MPRSNHPLLWAAIMHTPHCEFSNGIVNFWNSSNSGKERLFEVFFLIHRARGCWKPWCKNRGRGITGRCPSKIFLFSFIKHTVLNGQTAHTKGCLENRCDVRFQLSREADWVLWKHLSTPWFPSSSISHNMKVSIFVLYFVLYPDKLPVCVAGSEKIVKNHAPIFFIFTIKKEHTWTIKHMTHLHYSYKHTCDMHEHTHMCTFMNTHTHALWARIPEIQVRILSRAKSTFFPHTVSSIFRLSLTHTHTHTHPRLTHACVHIRTVIYNSTVSWM